MFVRTVHFIIHHGGIDEATKSEARKLLILWTVLPPVWFWFEYHIIYRSVSETERGNLEDFKHSQETGRNIWLALVAVLAGLYFKL